VINLEQIFGLTDSHVVALNAQVKIHCDVVSAWQQLVQAAAADGFQLTIASGFRSFSRQQLIWDGKCSGAIKVKAQDNSIVDMHQLSELEKICAIMLYSALPGASRHHWGCDFDVYDPTLIPENQKLQLEPWEYSEHGYFNQLNLWLEANLTTFNFFKPYRIYSGGIAAEPWHISYAPIAQQFQLAFTIEKLAAVIEKSTIANKNIVLNNLPQLFQQFCLNQCENPYA
jgi:LAS superfamily LD-carboxypeptidase LdcB